MFEAGFLFFSLVTLTVTLVCSRYLLGAETFGAWIGTCRNGATAVYTETKTLVGTVGRRGWRPYIPWCFGALLTVLVARIAVGAPLPDAGTLGVLLGPLGAMTAHAVQCRSADYRAGVANSPT
jgi:hypothetical protein